jgi:hypothetical protein
MSTQPWRVRDYDWCSCGARVVNDARHRVHHVRRPSEAVGRGVRRQRGHPRLWLGRSSSRRLYAAPQSGRIEVAVYERDATDESGHSVFVWLSRKEARRLRKQLTEALD